MPAEGKDDGQMWAPPPLPRHERFVAVSCRHLAIATDRVPGATLTGLTFDAAEVVCTLEDLASTGFRGWLRALTERRRSPQSPVTIRIERGA